jgi:hypothetical protein
MKILSKSSKNHQSIELNRFELYGNSAKASYLAEIINFQAIWYTNIF